METKSLNEKLNIDLLVNELPVDQLIDFAINSNDEYSGHRVREELHKRGKDNIHTRISIKKSCKASIAGLENILKKLEIEVNKGLEKSVKSKLLTSVSILDKLQLEWQRYDLGLKH